MSSPLPVVSIGMPVRNGADHVEAALEALLGQDYPAIELLVSDNCSTDSTWDVLQRFASRDHRIRIVRQSEDIGATRNFEFVLSAAQSPYFMWAACHDLWDHTFVRRAVEILEGDHNVVLVVPACEVIGVSGETRSFIQDSIETTGLSSSDRFLRVLKAWPKYSLYGLHRRQSMAGIPFLKTIGPDNLFLAELAFRGEFREIAEPLFKWRSMPHDGDWKAYALRNGRHLTWWTGPLLCIEFWLRHLKLSWSYSESVSAKVRLCFTTTVAMRIYLPLFDWLIGGGFGVASARSWVGLKLRAIPARSKLR